MTRPAQPVTCRARTGRRAPRMLTKGTHLSEIDAMIFDWEESKNDQLREERGVSFEHVVQAIESGNVLTILEHPNQAKYSGQRLYIIDIEGYAHVVPFVDREKTRFLKTIFPSRKYTRIYLREEEER